jgi:hypothetical protein
MVHGYVRCEGAANVVSGPRRSYWNMLKTYMGMKSYTPLSLIQQNRAVCGYHLGYLEDEECVAAAAKAILTLYEQGKIKPQIDSVWAYADVSVSRACNLSSASIAVDIDALLSIMF